MMENGLLRIWWEKGDLHWHYDPVDGTKQRALSKRSKRVNISRKELQECLDSFYMHWKLCLEDMQQDFRLSAQDRFDKARQELQNKIVPRDLNLSSFSDGLIKVILEPDGIPLEVLDAGGVPLGVRSLLLHNKIDRREDVTSPTDSQRTRRTSVSKQAGPAAWLRFNKDCLDFEALEAHQDNVSQSVKTIYGHDLKCTDCRLHIPGADSSPTKEAVLRALGRGDVSCLYLLAHGMQAETDAWALSLRRIDEKTVEFLDVETVRNRLRGDKALGACLAFINACGSAAVRSTNEVDLALALLEGGWQTVIGTVLPPMAEQGAKAAERFFESLRQHLNIAKAYREMVLTSWEQYHNNLPDLSWASYRLYGSPQLMWLRTPLTDDDGTILLREKKDTVLGVMDSDFRHFGESRPPELLSSKDIAALLKSIHDETASEVPLARRLLNAASVDPSKSIAFAILEHALRNPQGELAQDVFDSEMRAVLHAIRRRSPKDDIILDEDLLFEEIIGRTWTEDMSGVPDEETKANLLPEISLLHSLVKAAKLDRRIGIETAAALFAPNRAKHADDLFRKDDNCLMWERIDDSARSVLYWAWVEAERDMSVIELRHLLKGIGHLQGHLSIVVLNPDEKSRVSNVDRVFEIINDSMISKDFNLSKDRFSNSSLCLLAACDRGSVAPNSLKGKDLFCFRCFVHAFSLIPLASEKDREFLEEQCPGLKRFWMLWNLLTNVPKEIRPYVEIPKCVPGVAPQAIRSFADVSKKLTPVGRNKCVHLIKIDDHPTLEVLLAQIVETRIADNEPTNLIRLPWQRTWEESMSESGRQEGLKSRPFLQSLLTAVSTFFPLSFPTQPDKQYPSAQLFANVLKTKAKRDRFLLVLDMCRLDPDSGSWEASKPLRQAMEKGEFQAALVVDDNLPEDMLKELERWTDPCMRIEVTDVDDVNEILHYYLLSRLHEKGLYASPNSAADRYLDDTLAARIGAGKRALLSVSRELIEKAIGEFSTASHSPDILNQVYSKAREMAGKEPSSHNG